MKKLNATKHTALVILLLALATMAMIQTPANADPTIEWLGSNFPLDINADGSVVVGNTGDGLYEAFRWTADNGVVRLGMCPTEVLGSPGGTPDVSDDGNRISATVLSADSTYVTQGIWTKGEGWETSMPPLAPDSSPSNSSLGSTWGLSGDGTTLTGFYWRDGTDGMGSAHINTWSESEGLVALGSPIRNCRGNDLSYDGSVVVGWSEREDGIWCPTVWENGSYTILHNQDHFTEATGVSNDGNTIWGKSYNPTSNHIEATLWLRTDTGWQEAPLGVLPGTFPGYGQAICRDMTEDGSIAVGYNEFDWGYGTGFVWTMEQGMISAADFFEDEGFVLPEYFMIATLEGISADGVVITGFGYDSSVYPYQYEGFVATRENVSAVSDYNAVPRGLRVDGNFPNPFNPSTTIALTLDRDQTVQLNVYNAAGRLVRQLQSGTLSAGKHEIVWNGRDDRGMKVASGIYFARVSSNNGNVPSHRMMLVK